MSNAADLHTGYEWLARDKIDAYCDEMSETNELKHEILWMDILTGRVGKSVDIRSGMSVDDKDNGAELMPNVDDAEHTLQLPLYPLPAVHLPTPGQIHTLNNVEPRNIKMANDLIDPDNTNGFDGRFCVTLRASDTGRIAQTATLMRVVNTTRQESFDGSLLAIRVECVAEGLVEVQQILNPTCWSKEKRIKKSDEYLVANVRPIDEDNMRQGGDDDDRLVVQAIAEKAVLRADDECGLRTIAIRPCSAIFGPDDFFSSRYIKAGLYPLIVPEVRLLRALLLLLPLSPCGA